MNDQLEQLLPLACAWVQEQEALILESGVPLNSSQLKDAMKAGVQHPEKIRILFVKKFPEPDNRTLLAAGQKAGLFGPQVAARCCRYGLYLHESLPNKREFREFLTHECVHTGQYERHGGIEPHIRELLEELEKFPYPNGPMEQEARTLSWQIVNDQPVTFSIGWFDTPLRRDPGLIVKPEWEEREQIDKRACCFLGAVKADDSVELVAIRECDPFTHIDHQHYGWTLTQKLFCWYRKGLLKSYPNAEDLSIEDTSRIEVAIQRKVDALQLGADTESSYYKGYTGIPWQNAGASRAGVSCSGLVWLWLHEQNIFHAPAPTLPAIVPMECDPMPVFKQDGFRVGDVAFFRNRKTGQVQHCAVCIGPGKYLHILRMFGSRIENGLTLFNRIGLELVGALSPAEAHQFYIDVEKHHLAKATEAATP